jgi:hypothetical protein
MAKKAIRPIRIEGNVAYVPLTQGYEAIIDAADVPSLSAWNWCAKPMRHTVYAVRNEYAAGKLATVYLHRAINGASGAFEVDHINGNGLDNRRANLRSVTAAQNRHNQRRRRDNTSGFRGVSFVKSANKWEAYISLGGKKSHLGFYHSAEDASKAYAVASAELHGQYGRAS